jgi:hypothetical protein
VDNDILQFVSSVDNGADVLDAIYQNPQTVLTLKAQPLMGKIAMLMNLSAHSRKQADPSQGLAPMPAASKITSPTTPKKTGGGVSDPFRGATTAADWYRAKQAQKQSK